MSAKKIPATSSVRRAYVTHRLPMVWAVEDAEGEFDRWLAGERARIYAEGYQAASSLRMGPMFNPYRGDAA